MGDPPAETARKSVVIVRTLDGAAGGLCGSRVGPKATSAHVVAMIALMP
jgi:hypothetical protein